MKAGIISEAIIDSIVFLLSFNSGRLESFECIQLTFKFTGSYPFIGFITKFSSDTEKRMLSNTVSNEDIKTMINNISLIVIGAYDKEGYLNVEIKQN